MKNVDELLKMQQRLREKIHKLIEEGISLTNEEIVAISQELDIVLNKYAELIKLEEEIKIRNLDYD